MTSRDITWSADEACSAGLLAVASDGTGSIVAEWGKVRWESLHLLDDWSGRLVAMVVCLGKIPPTRVDQNDQCLEESRPPSSYLAGSMKGAGQMEFGDGSSSRRLATHFVAMTETGSRFCRLSSRLSQRCRKVSFCSSRNGRFDSNLTWIWCRLMPTLAILYAMLEELTALL